MKRKLLLLHGALESSSQFKKLREVMRSDFDVHSFDFVGHGQNPTVEKFEIGELSNQLADYLKNNDLNSVIILGYSMGGYVALHALPEISEHVDAVYTLATKLDWNEDFIQNELKKLNPAIIEEKVPKLIVKLEHDHSKSPWKSILKATAHMMRTILEYPLNSTKIQESQTPVYILRGSEDNMVSHEESLAFANGISNATYIQLDDTPHMFHRMNPELISNTILNTKA